jgi:hypothetical protein
VDVIDGAEHLLEVKPDFFLVMVVLNSGNILEKRATRNLFKNYVRAASLIVRLIKYLMTVWVVMEHSNQTFVRAQKFINLNFSIERFTSRIHVENLDCNISVLIVSTVPKSGISTILQYIGACVSSIKNVSTPQFILFG